MDRIIITSAVSVMFIVLSSGLCYFLVQWAKSRFKGARPQVDQFEKRIQTIETRLLDIQDIVISIDDQLKRLDRPGTPPPATSRELS